MRRRMALAPAPRRTVDLLARQAFHMDHPLAAVDLDDLAVAALKCPANDLNLVVPADGHRAHLRGKAVHSAVL